MTLHLIGAAIASALAMHPGPASAAPSPLPRTTAQATQIVARGILPREQARDLYSARARRLVTGYLRLRLLELRKTDLDRARAVIEGKLGVDALLGEPLEHALR